MDVNELKKRADAGDANAMYELACKYVEESTTEEDGLELMERAADAGSAQAEEWLRDYYFDPDGGSDPWD